MTKFPKSYLLVSASVILTLLLVFPYLNVINEDNPPLLFELEVTVKDEEGDVVRHFTQKDPPTRGMGALMQIILAPYAGDTDTLYIVEVVDMSGVTKNISTGNSMGAVFASHGNTKIWIGNGSGTAAYTDYTLFNPVDSKIVSDPSIAIVGSNIVVSLAATFSFTESNSITETGLSTMVNDYLSNVLTTEILLAHSTFSEPIAVYPGWTLTITYKITLGG